MIRIIIPQNASEVEKNAAAELCEWLGKAYSDEFAVAREPEEGLIYVGHTAFAAWHGIAAADGWNERSDAESWIIKAICGKLVLTGGKKSSDRGVIYAAEHFIEEIAGVRFWNAMERYIPENGAFAFDGDLEMSGIPKADMRFPISCSWIGDDMMQCVRRRTNSGVTDAWGGSVVASRRGNCHTVNTILRPDGLFEKHPDWFAWNEKEQRRLPYGQYCLNNEEFCEAWEKAFLDDIDALYAECDRRGESRPHHMHISLADDAFDCECPKCREMRAKSGQTGNFLRFANRMAEAADKKYPGIIVEILAYLTYMELPLDDVVPAKNIMVRLADLDIDILHGFDHPNNAHALDILKGWAKLCEKNGNPLAIWDYNINVRISTPVCNAYRLQKMIKTYDSYGVCGYFIEHEEPMLSDFWGLKNWLLTHLFEDPDCDCGALYEDYMTKYYGPAAPYMKKYNAYMDGIAAKSALRMRCVENFCKVDQLPYEAYIEGSRIMDEAEKTAGYDREILRRVRQARASLDIAIAERFAMLKQYAERKGLEFPFSYEQSILRWQLTVNETWVQTEEYRREHGIASLQPWEGLTPALSMLHPYIPGELPDELKGKKVLEIPLYDFITQEAKNLGLRYVTDEDSPTGYAVRAQNDCMPEYVRDKFICRSKDDPTGTLSFKLRHRAAVDSYAPIGTPPLVRPLPLEELKPGRYSLYKAFDIDGLEEGTNSLLMIGHYVIPPHISGFAKFLDSPNVTIWISMKPTGKAYGGSESDVDALWFDRMFIEER